MGDYEQKNVGSSILDIEEKNINKIAQELDNPLEFDHIVLKPNATTIDEIVAQVNQNQDTKALSSILGKLIEPGKLGIIGYNGSIQVVGPGRWILPNPRAEWIETVSLVQNHIKNETLTIVRVQRGELGLAMENGQPVLLGEGIHVRNSRLFIFDKFKSVKEQNLQHGSLHIIRVPKGSFALVTESNVPKLLAEGVHIANSNLLTFVGLQPANQPHLCHGTIHLIRVPKGQVALVTDNNKPKLLGEGTHFINSNTFNYKKMESLMLQSITHQTITRFRVRRGEIGLAWENNQPVFFEEGVYEKDSPNFSFVKCVSASEKQITLGSKKIVTVWDGEVGVSFMKGKLKVLFPNRHIIESAEHIFQGFLSTQQQCLHLVHEDAKKKGQENLLTCETKDFVEIGIKADVFYRIADAEKVLLVVGIDNVITLVKETSIATLNSIIRSTTLSEVAQNKEVAARSEKAHALQMASQQPNSPTAPLFFDKVHDEFISKLHDSFMERYGIEITNVRIESFKIMNAELSNNISKQALVTTQTETQLTNLTSQTEIATAQQRRDADVARIKAEGDAVKLKTEVDARNNATMETAKAEAEATLIAAKAQASAVELKAKAEAQAILAIGDAEARRADMLQKTPLAGQISLFQLYSEMVKASMSGVERVVYLPPDGASNPLAFMSMMGAMQQGNSGITGKNK